MGSISPTEVESELGERGEVMFLAPFLLLRLRVNWVRDDVMVSKSSTVFENDWPKM